MTKNLKKNKNKSMSLLDGNNIVETVYNQAKGSVSFAVHDAQNSTTTYQPEYTDSLGSNIQPPKAVLSLLSAGVLLLPEMAEEYESEKALDESIRNFIRKYYQTDDDFLEIYTTYIKLTWLYDRFNELPYLRLSGPEGTGKSRGLKVIGSLCYKASMVGNISDAALFRLIDITRGTILCDEGDVDMSTNTSIFVKVLNNGFQKGMPIIRTNPTNTGVDTFFCFGPKILGMHSYFQDSSLETRFVTEYSHQKNIDSKIPRNLPQDFITESIHLRNQLLMYRFKNFNKELNLHKLSNEELSNRVQQIYNPMMSLITNAHEEEIIRRHAYQSYQEIKTNKATSVEAEVLMIVKNLIDEGITCIYNKNVLDTHNVGKEYRDRISSKRLGFILNKKLRLTTARDSKGFYIPTRDNITILERVFKEYGVVDEDYVYPRTTKNLDSF